MIYFVKIDATKVADCKGWVSFFPVDPIVLEGLD